MSFQGSQGPSNPGIRYQAYIIMLRLRGIFVVQQRVVSKIFSFRSSIVNAWQGPRCASSPILVQCPFSGGIEMWHWTKMGIAASMIFIFRIFLPQCQPTNIYLFKFNKKKTVEGVKTPER